MKGSSRPIRGPGLGGAVALALLAACHGGSGEGAGAPGDAAAVGAAAAPTASAAGSATKAGSAAPAGSAAQTGPAARDAPGVKLAPAAIAHLGLTVVRLDAVEHAAEISGFAQVLPHEAIAQAAAELRIARAVERQSRTALERMRRLGSTPGALPVETLESAERQATVDRAALDLANDRSSSIFGEQAPWRDQDDSATLRGLSSGALKLVRVTFPAGTLGDEAPLRLRLVRLGPQGPAPSWEAHEVWKAPADSGVPGRSFFAISREPGLIEGERLMAWTARGATAPGVVIPASAAVISNGRYWCYVQTAPGEFERRELDAGTPTRDGYFVALRAGAGPRQLGPGTAVVTSGAGLLLARELGAPDDADAP